MNNNKKILFSLLAVVMIAMSCNKVDINKGITNNEKAIVKLPFAVDELHNIAVDAVPGTIEIIVCEVRRDIVSSTDLNSTQVVKVAPNPQLIEDFNTNNGTDLTTFTNYTLNPETPFDGENWIVTFNPGEFSKNIKISFDPSKLNLGKRNALAFTIACPGRNAKISSDLNSSLVEVAVKNKYDGVYRVTGTLVDGVRPDITGYYPMDVELVTTGATTVKMVSLDWGFEAHTISAGGNPSYYGSFAPIFNFDPATDNVVAVTNFYGQPAGNTRSAMLDPSGVNSWDPATKTLTVKYFMKQPSSVPASPNVRTTFEEEYQYLGPR